MSHYRRLPLLIGCLLWTSPALATSTDRALEGSCDLTYQSRSAVVAAAISGPAPRASIASIQVGIASEALSDTFPEPTVSIAVAPLTLLSDDLAIGLSAQISQSLPWSQVRSHQRGEAAAQTAVIQAHSGDIMASTALLAATLLDILYVAEHGVLSVQEEMEHLTQLHGTAVAMITAGVTSTSDVLQVEAAMATVELEELEWRSQAEAARLQLTALTGGNAELVVNSSPSCLPNPEEIAEEWEHPAIVGARAQVEAADHRVAIAEMAALPTPMITGGVSNTRMNWEHSVTFGVGLNIPLPSEVRAQRERSSASQAAATLDLAWLQEYSRASVSSALVELETALEQVEVVEGSLIPAAMRLARVTNERVAMGEAPMFETIQAERGLTTAKMQLIRSVAKAWTAYATLQRATGQFGNATSEREQ